MSKLETVLTRMMNDAIFASQLFADTYKMLAGYNLSAEEVQIIKSMPRAEFMSHALEARKSFAILTLDGPTGSGGTNHNQTALRISNI